MDNRKERTKRLCGFNDYSWSSDDEDNDGPLDLARRQSNQHPSTTELLGPNSETQSPSSPQSNSPARRTAKMDRDAFWSLINRPPRLTSLRLFETTSQPSSYVSRLSAAATPAACRDSRPERTVSADVQRIIAFKRLTRNMNAIRPNRPGSSSYPIYSSRSAGPSRNPLFSQSIASPSPMVNKTNAAKNPKRLQITRPVLCFNRAGRFAISSAPIAGSSSEPRASTSGACSRTTHATTGANRPVSLEETFNLDQSDDDADGPSTSGLKMTSGRDGHENLEIEEEAGSGMAVEDEVVELDPPADPTQVVSPAPRMDTVDGDVASGQMNANEPDLSVPTQQPRDKRKREGSEEYSEPLSVKEFNLSLLRLLECPVCLEWMEPPIAQCRRGHLVCSRCRERLSACPVCRTSFSSVRNRAMEAVAELLRYPCRHGCGREVRLRRRSPHEASCIARKYQCPASLCEAKEPLAHGELALHFQSRHLDMLKIGHKHTFSMKVTTEHHDDWLIMALQEYFHLRVEIDVRTYVGIIIYVAYIGPKCNAKNFTYEITIVGQHNARRLVYARSTHSDLESSSVNVTRQDCFHLTLDQALNFLRFKNRHCDPDKYLDFNVEITKNEQLADAKETSDT